MPNPLPRRHLGQLRAILVNLIPRQLAPAGIQIDLVNREPAGAFPEESADPKDDDDGEAKVRFEEPFGVVELVVVASGGDRDEELHDFSVSKGHPRVVG